ncbi:hypothetical protein EKO04_006902 [Ascochyta lentis]|uniref:Uncharacterized protein n=1 Tax=Ascochyta lentis TaxID=205686 RepID=A0A8H7J3D2_9PLEO|nr:hypothetical protein EKO04_006902 [Ascochyta lentis]
MNGYWKFNSYDDDRRAYKCGLYTPEAVLIAQDVGDGVYDNITLRWVSGKLDPENRPTVGTAAAHLEAIYNERRILGKSLSFRGRVPLYSISTEQRLVNYRITRSGTQGDALSEEVLVSPSQHTFSSDTVSLIVASGGCTRSRTPLSVSAPASLHRAQDKSTLNDVQVDNSLYTANFQPTSDGIGASPASVPSRIPSPLAQANEATLSLRAPDELAASNYRDLVADVKRFDPGPWTTHVGPPKEVAVDDPHTQVQGMAEMIRNLETSKEDPELQTLDAEFTVLLWALKSSGNVQIMKA